MLKVRKMMVDDLPAILSIQASCYYDMVHESGKCLEAKINASPDTCFVCTNAEAKVIGYVISIPIERFNPPALNTPKSPSMENANCLYLHDMAVSTQYKGQGIGESLADEVSCAFKEIGFQYASLIAIQGAHTYWEQLGFKEVEPTESLSQKIASYGSKAKYMEYRRTAA